jgi:hypothetical protein
MKPKTIQILIISILLITSVIIAVLGYNEYSSKSYLENPNCQYPMVGCYYSNSTSNYLLYLQYLLIISGVFGAVYSIVLYFVRFNHLKLLPLMIPVILLAVYLIMQALDSSKSFTYPL